MLKPLAQAAALLSIGAAAALVQPLLGAPVAAFAPPAPTRSVFVNGIDVSSARALEMKNVDVLINEQGDVFINAPHYQVNEEDTYVPLSKYVQGAGAPAHKPMQKVGAEAGPVPVTTPGAPVNSPLPVTAPEGAEAPKAGSDTPSAEAPAGADQAALQGKPGVKVEGG